jgi:hypothetical protein
LFCDVGDDSQFPALNNTTVPGSYFSIHTEYPIYYSWNEAFYGRIGMWHTDPQPGYTPTQKNQLWANAADLVTFGFSAFPTGGNIANSDHPIGVYWTQVQTYQYELVNLHENISTGVTPMPTDSSGKPFVANVQNVYTGTEAAWDYGVCLYTYTTPFSYRWLRIPYCDPTPIPSTYGYVAHMAATPGNIILGTDVNGAVSEITNSFTSNALTALANIANTSWDELAADDRVSSQPRDESGPNAILVDTGTTRIRGAFTRSGSRIDEQQPATPVGTQSTVSLRTYAAMANALYSLEAVPSNGTWQLATRNVSDALAGVSTVSTVNLGTAFASPKAIAYNRTNGLVYVVDAVPSLQNHYQTLVTINPSSGALNVLWRSGSYSGTVPSATVSTTTDGEVLVGFTGRGDGLYHVLHMDSTGRPWHSMSGSGSLYSTVVGHSGSITIPLAQTATSSQPNATFSNVGWDSMTTGACGSSWLQTYFGRGASGATGALLNGLVCP